MRDPDSGWIQLSSVELYLLWSAMDADQLPAVLGIAHVGRTAEHRAALVETVSSALRARDLGTVAEPARDLAAALRLVAEHDVAVDARVYGQGAPLFGFAASGGRGAVAVARVGDEVRINRIGAEAMVSTLLAPLAQLPAGAGRPANISVTDFAAACAEGERDGVSGFGRVLREAGIREPEVNMLTKALTSRQAGGQLGATGQRRGGKAMRTSSTVNWVDTADGRYALRRSGDWLTVTPVDLPRLTSMADEMVADLRR